VVENSLDDMRLNSEVRHPGGYRPAKVMEAPKLHRFHFAGGPVIVLRGSPPGYKDTPIQGSRWVAGSGYEIEPSGSHMVATLLNLPYLE
jgi:hypothetical protein